MRKRQFFGVAFLGVGLVASLSAACGDKKGAIMLAINTDMKAPKDVNAVSVTISANGNIIHSAIGRVTPQGDVLLPATLAVAEGDDANKSIRIRVMAFQDRKARVLRDVRTSIPKGGRVATLRIPLNFVNDGSAVGGQLPNGVLPDPNPGTGGSSSGSSGSSGASSGTSGASSGTSGASSGTSGASSGTSGASSGTSGASSGTSGDVSSSGGTVSAGEFDFFNEFQPDCPDPIAQTRIDGECKDNFVDPETLPDFDPSQIGDSTNPGSCFDVVKCLASATSIGGPTEQTDGGVDVPDASAGRDSGDVPPPKDAGAGFKNLEPQALSFDINTCELNLGGASSSRLNLAIATPDTGECVRPGECYIPIDKGAGGWNEVDGKVKLPNFVCTLIKNKKLRLVQSFDVCAAKEENNPICAPKKGDLTPQDGGTGPVTLVAKADFASTVASDTGQIGWGGADGFYFANLFQVPLQPFKVAAIPNTKLPWHINVNKSGPLVLTNGTSQGYTINNTGPESVVVNVGVPQSTQAGAGVRGAQTLVLWGSTSAGGGLFSSLAGQPGTASKATVQGTAPVSVSALLGVGDVQFLVGQITGDVQGCQANGSQFLCTAPTKVAQTRIDQMLVKPNNPASGYVLAQDSLISVNVEGTSITKTYFIPTQTSGQNLEGNYYPRSMAVSSKCVYFSSDKGLEWAIDSGNAFVAQGVLVPRGQPAAGEILGVAIGPDNGSTDKSATVVYFGLFAGGSAGGGIYKVNEPDQCRAASGGDAGVGPDASGTDGGTGNCNDGQCRTTTGQCVNGVSTATFCGIDRGPCHDCVKENGAGSTCVGGTCTVP